MVVNLVRGLIFPAGIAQRDGSYELVGEDRISGRVALVVEFRAQPDDLIFDRSTIDFLTGLVLRHQVINTSGGDVSMDSELTIYPIVYDPVYAADFFKLEIPEEVKFQEAPE